MLSKVLAGEGARSEPLVWRRVAQARLGGAPPDEAVRVLEGRLAEAEQQSGRREQQAYAAGLEKGKADGLAEASARLEPAIEGYGRAAAQLIELRRRVRRDAEEDLVRLALAIARRILNRELSVDPEALLGIVKAALARLEGREVDRLRVHPQDAALVERHLAGLGLGDRIKVAPDAQLSRGAAIFDTARGSLDASVETQLDEIRRGLLDRINRSCE